MGHTLDFFVKIVKIRDYPTLIDFLRFLSKSRFLNQKRKCARFYRKHRKTCQNWENSIEGETFLTFLVPVDGPGKALGADPNLSIFVSNGGHFRGNERLLGVFLVHFLAIYDEKRTTFGNIMVKNRPFGGKTNP